MVQRAQNKALSRDVGTREARGHAAPTPTPITSISESNKVQQFQFQTQGLLLFMSVQKLHWPEISQYLLCMLQFLNNLWQLFIFSNNIEIGHFKLDLLKRSENFLIVDHPKEDHNKWEFKHLFIGRLLALIENYIMEGVRLACPEIQDYY